LAATYIPSIIGSSTNSAARSLLHYDAEPVLSPTLRLVGLKLEAIKSDIEVAIIDGALMPSEN